MCRILLLWRHKSELTALGVDTESGEDVAHLIVENVEDLTLNEEGDIDLALLLYSAECLRTFVARLGGQGITIYRLTHLIVAICSKPAIHIASSRNITCLYEVDFGTVRVDYDTSSAHTVDVLN